MTPEEQGGKTASEEPPTRLYLSAYQGQFFDEDVEYMRLESIAELLEARAAQFFRPSVAAHELERMAREIRDDAHHEGER